MKHIDQVRAKYERDMIGWAKRYPVAAGVIASNCKLSVAEFKELQMESKGGENGKQNTCCIISN